MAIDWNYLFDLNVDELSDEKTDILYNQLVEFNPNDEENVQRLRKLFEVCKSIMQIRTVEAQVAVEELEDTLKKYDKNEIQLLRKELEIFKQSDIRGENIAQKLSESNDQIIELRDTIELKDNEIIKMKQKLNELQTSLEFRDKEVSALRSEVESLREEIDNQRHVDEQVLDRQEPIEKLREKNKQIQRLLDELREVETINLELTNQIKKLKFELKCATNELQISGNQMEMLSKQMNELKQLNEDFIREKELLTEEINRLSEELNKYENTDHDMIDKYSENIQQLRHLLELKDEEIIKLKSSLLTPDQTFKDNYKRITKEIEEKNRQIDLLKSQLNEAVIDMESQTEIIKKLVQQNRGDEEVSKLKQTVVSLTNQLKTTEEEMLAKDEELLALRKRINSYEREEYGLKDALKEVSDLSKHLNDREYRIEEMIQQINELKLKLNDAEDMIEGVQNRRPDSDMEITKTEKMDKIDKKDKIKVLETEKELLKLEEDKIDLTERLRSTMNKFAVNKVQENREINSLKERLKSIERENLELQLGMKEILNGIRETDCQSDFIIECPSLERVCQLMESRNISGDLTNIIALKAELDLVRGHNEQIRTDMRRLRNDYLKVISQYTQDLLESDVISSEPQIDDYLIQSKELQTKTITDEKASQTVLTLSDDIINEREDILEYKQQSDRIEPDLVTRETQTLIISASIPINQSNSFTQTDYYIESKAEPIITSKDSAKNLCENCKKVMKIVDFLKNCVQKLEQNIKSSENKFTQRLQLLETENRNLTESLNKRLNEKDLKLAEKDTQIEWLQNQITGNQLVPSIPREESPFSDEQRIVRVSQSKQTTQLSSSCKTVLESVINCLQARLEHKDESIRQYQNMLSEAKQNFENEMIGLIESNKESEAKNSINFSQLIDNEELQSALKSCVNELEICKTELNTKIRDLETELERKNAKLIAYQNENEMLRLRRSAPNSQLKQSIDQLNEEIKQKDLIITDLNKTIKNDRAMRAVRPPREPLRESSAKNGKKVDNQLFQEIADLRTVIESQKLTIKSLEVVKWDLEKNLKEFKEQMKQKSKERETEISELKQKLDKIKIRFNKNENEKQILQNKITKRENASKNISNKWTQTMISSQNIEQQLNEKKNELKKLKNDLREKEIEAKDFENELKVCRQTESELKTLLKESVKREKLATIEEESTSTQLEEEYEKLLQENAQIKVELRMAEFELKRRTASKS